MTQWNATAPFTRLVALLTALEESPGVPWLGAVYEGVPRNVGEQVAAYVTLGGQTLSDHTMDPSQRREVTYMVTFVYEVAEAPATAERGIIGAVDDFLEVLATETNTRTSVLFRATVDPGLGDTAEYEPLVALEFRRYPIRVTLSQDRAVS